MATVYGVNRTKLNTPNSGNLIGTGENKSGVYVIKDTYEASSLAANDVIQVGDLLPQGAMVTRIVVIHDDLGTSTTMDVGDSTDVDRYIDGADTATAAAVAQFPNATCINGVGYKIGTNAGDDQIQITNLGASATGTIEIIIEYAL